MEENQTKPERVERNSLKCAVLSGESFLLIWIIYIFPLISIQMWKSPRGTQEHPLLFLSFVCFTFSRFSKFFTLSFKLWSKGPECRIWEKELNAARKWFDRNKRKLFCIWNIFDPKKHISYEKGRKIWKEFFREVKCSFELSLKVACILI